MSLLLFYHILSRLANVSDGWSTIVSSENASWIRGVGATREVTPTRKNEESKKMRVRSHRPGQQSYAQSREKQENARKRALPERIFLRAKARKTRLCA